MEIGKYKQAMSYLLNQNATTKTFALNPNAKLSDNDPQPIFGFEDGGRIGFKTGGDVQKWVQENYPEVKFDFKKHPKMGLGTLDKDYSMIRSAITKKLNNPNYVKPSLDIYINKIADAFLKAYAKDDISYLGSENKYNKNGMLSNAEISFLSHKINSPTGVQELVDKTGLKAEQILDMLDERQSFIELDLIPEMSTTSRQLHSQNINKSIDQGEDWLIKNSKNYDSVKDLKKGFTRVFGQDHPLLRKSLRSSYGMPKLNPLFFEEKTKTYQSHGKPAFIYGEPEMKNLFEASLYNFNPTVRDKVLNELKDILPKEKIDENTKYDLRKKFQNSEVLSEFGINKGLKGPVTRLLIKDLGDDVINNINFIRYPRTEVGHYINYLKDKVAPKYRKQFNLVNDALIDIKKNNYNGAKQKLNIAENINFDHKVPKYLIDAGYADELEYIKLNPVGEKFNQVAKNKSFDGPMARLSRKYAATKVPEEKTKIIEDMNELKDNFNKRYNNYLSDLNIEEVNGKLNVSSSAKPITSSDELIKTLETNVKENPQFFKLEEVYDKAGVTQKEREALNLIKNQFSSGLDPELIKKLYAEEIDMVGNAVQKIGRTGKGALKVFDELMVFGKGPIGRGAGYALGAGLPILFAGEETLKGNYKQAGRELLNIPTLGFGLPESWIGSFKTDLVKHAKEKGFDADAIERFLNKEQISSRITDSIDLLDMGSQNEKFIKSVDDKRKSLLKEYDDIKLSPSDKNNFDMVLDSFTRENYGQSLLPKDMIDFKTKKEVNKFKKTLDPDFLGENNIKISPDTIEPNMEDLSDYYKVSAADGGRIGFSEGSGPKMGRRGFLGLLAGTAAAPEILKALRAEKNVAKTVGAISKIKLEKAEGMYPWFPNLVEKIKTVGKPFEEKDLIMEASYKHEAKGYGGLPKGIEKLTKHVDGDTTFILREYPDGRLAVDIHSPRNQEMFETPVTLYYRPTMELQYHSGVKVEPAEFKVLEKEPRYFANGPDDVDIEMSETRKVPGKDTIFGDVEAAERFATGDIKNRKVIKAKQARRDQMMDQPTDFIEETAPYGPVYD